MEENIEVKDVQRTEYLDKNGLDMLWAKVKENTHNQVEVERNRAVAKENSIIDTKADKSALDNYVLNSALTALEQKVAANTTAIEGKQDAGNYITFEKRGLNEDRAYIIKPSYYIESRTNEFDNGKYNYLTMAGQYISVANASGKNVQIDSEGITISDSGNASNSYHLSLGYNGISSRSNSPSHSLLFSLNKYGVKLEGGSNNRVLTSNGSTIDITEYAKKTDIQAGGKFVPYVEKGPNHYNQAETYFLSNGLQFGDAQTNHTVILPQAFDARQDNRKLQLSVDSLSEYAIDILDYGTNKGMKVLWNPIKLAFTPETNNTDGGTTYSLAGVRLYAANSSKKSENTLVLGTDEDYKEIGVDIAPLENGKVPTAYLTAATKEELGVVKVGGGLNVTDGTISVDSTAIAALEAKVTDNTAAITNINVSKGIPYDASVTDKYQTDKDFSVKNSHGATADFGPNNGIRLSNENFAFGVNTTDCIKFSVQNGTIYSRITPYGLESEVNDETYANCSSDSFLEIKNRENRISLQPAQLLAENGHITILMNHKQILIKNIVDNTQAMLTPYKLLMKTDDSQVILNSNGVSLPNGDNNHVLTSNASTIDITQYALKSVYDEKIAALEARIAALEARIAALEAKHAETA